MPVCNKIKILKFFGAQLSDCVNVKEPLYKMSFIDNTNSNIIVFTDR